MAKSIIRFQTLRQDCKIYTRFPCWPLALNVRLTTREISTVNVRNGHMSLIYLDSLNVSKVLVNTRRLDISNWISDTDHFRSHVLSTRKVHPPPRSICLLSENRITPAKASIRIYIPRPNQYNINIGNYSVSITLSIILFKNTWAANYMSTDTIHAYW